MADIVYALESDWKALSLLVAFMSVLFSISLIMISRLFANPKLEQSAKSELIFAASTVILVMFVITIVPFAEQLSLTFLQELYSTHLVEGTLDPNMTVIDVVIIYLNNLSVCAVRVLNILFAIDIPVQAVLSIVMEVVMSELASGFFMNFFSERITNTTEVLIFYLVIYYVIYYILLFIKYFGMMFFTLGVLLRAFPPTRGAGAFIMALCIGLYFIFPMSYILIGIIMLDSGGPIICDITEIPLVKECTDVNGKITCNTAGSLSASNLFEKSLYVKSASNWFMSFLNWLGTFMNNFIMMMCFVPFLALTLTLSFILSTSSLFGATIPEVGRGLVKLI
ncbi:MAG: hypothetical protein PHU63_01490 [Candidatus ainarchaeum sp.]|nr:hypothetical protein [Candidatus ainarchaeum sp.]